MKTIYPVVGLLSSLLFFSCTSNVNTTKKIEDTVSNPKETPTPLPDSTAHSQAAGNAQTVNLVKLKLAKMFKDDLSKNLIDEQSRKFRIFEQNINEDPKNEIFVGLTGPYFCGSGGCTVLLLNPEGELITRFTVTANPILIGDSSTKGWKDLILQSSGKDHLIKFDGKTYPANPTIQPVYTANSSSSVVKGLNSSDQLYTW